MNKTRIGLLVSMIALAVFSAPAFLQASGTSAGPVLSIAEGPPTPTLAPSDYTMNISPIAIVGVDAKIMAPTVERRERSAYTATFLVLDAGTGLRSTLRPFRRPCSGLIVTI